MTRAREYAGIQVPTITATARVIGLKPADWRGRCHEVACLMLKTKLVPGVERYGHYYGPVRPGFYTAGRPFYRHGWIEAAPDVVVDPTRWVFEARRAYIYIGPGADYDACGSRLAASRVGAYPSHWMLGDDSTRFNGEAFEAHEAREIIDLGLAEDDARYVAELTNGHGEGFSFGQLMWLANLPLDWYGPHARAVYEAFKRVGRKALIPIDNWRTVMERPLAENRA
jgi:hypothetical protein